MTTAEHNVRLHKANGSSEHLPLWRCPAWTLSMHRGCPASPRNSASVAVKPIGISMQPMGCGDFGHWCCGTRMDRSKGLAGFCRLLVWYRIMNVNECATSAAKRFFFFEMGSTEFPLEFLQIFLGWPKPWRHDVARSVDGSLFIYWLLGPAFSSTFRDFQRGLVEGPS